jgi:hypothetical protein
LQWKKQIVFCLPLDHLVQDPFDIAAGHLFLFFPQWCLVLLAYGGIVR